MLVSTPRSNLHTTPRPFITHNPSTSLPPSYSGDMPYSLKVSTSPSPPFYPTIPSFTGSSPLTPQIRTTCTHLAAGNRYFRKPPTHNSFPLSVIHRQNMRESFRILPPPDTDPSSSKLSSSSPLAPLFGNSLGPTYNNSPPPTTIHSNLRSQHCRFFT